MADLRRPARPHKIFDREHPEIFLGWSAAGHQFGETMRCELCGVSYKRHQYRHGRCPLWWRKVKGRNVKVDKDKLHYVRFIKAAWGYSIGETAAFDDTHWAKLRRRGLAEKIERPKPKPEPPRSEENKAPDKQAKTYSKKG